MLNRKLRMGLIGGGPGSFIGHIHHKSAIMDGKAELVAGAFSRNPEKSKQTGKSLMLDDSRIYPSWEQMLTSEMQLPADEQIDFVAITTPNDSHFPIARDFLNAGFHVMCEKPMTLNLQEAKELKEIVKKSGNVFGLLHNYTGYPMVKLARDIVRAGDIGNIRKVVVQYRQGWLTTALEKSGNIQAEWRSDPARSGAGGALGDIGTHAENLVEYITGLQIKELCADLRTYVPGRILDDDVNCLLRFDSGAGGLLHASQISAGEENGLAIWIFGDLKSLEWHQENPNYLYLKQDQGVTHVWKHGNTYVDRKSPAAARATRLPFGHPEGFIEAFANIYNNFNDTLRAVLVNEKPDELFLDFPDVDDGVRGMRFIETVIKSANSDQKWTTMVP
jgi:predicted dehydrogenase